MNSTEKLSILKKDLQIANTANDEYLTFLLNTAEELMRIEGIHLASDDIKFEAVQIHYAAYLFRARAATNGARFYSYNSSGSTEARMPRFLRYELNELVFSKDND